MPTVPYVANLSLPGSVLTSGPVDIPVVGEIAGDFVVVHVHTLARGTTVNTALLPVPLGWSLLVDSFTATNQWSIFYRQVSGPIDGLTISNYSAEQRRYMYGSFVVRAASAVSFGGYVGYEPPFGGSGDSGAGLTVTEDDSLAAWMSFAVQDAGDGSLSLGLPSGYTHTAENVLVTPDTISSRRLSTTTASANTAIFNFTVAATHLDEVGVELGGFVFDPITVVVPDGPLPTTGDPRRLSLNCAETYTVWLTDSSYANTIDRLGWSSIQYERVLDDISAATLTLPDELGGLRCNVKIPQIQNWEYGILIERNDQPVWQGPITSISRQQTAKSIRVTCSDVLVRQSRNLAIWLGTKEYDDVDAGAVFTDIVNVQSRTAADTYVLHAPTFYVGEPVTRTLISRRLELAWTVLQELLDSTIDAFVANGLLYCWSPTAGWVYGSGTRTVELDGPYNAGMDLQYGMFTNESFAEQPDWTMSGLEQANYVATPGADSGDLGFRDIYTAQDGASQERYGVLAYVNPNTLHRPDDEDPAQTAGALQRRADTVLALRANAPAIISNGSLAVGAPIDFNNLWPGSLWDIDYWDHGYGQLLTTGRLQRVSVNVTADNGVVAERVTPTIYPIGYTG